ncbi:MAG: hypothetical protein PHT34_00740 [Oscillospiraceae bacterium]|nr:hypothetical protein [Oscillospiraceae bacterium]
MSRVKKNHISLIDTWGHASRHWDETPYAQTIANRESDRRERDQESPRKSSMKQ